MRGKSRELKNEWGTISLVTAVSPSPDSDAHFLSSHPGEPRDAISEVGESWRYEGAMAKSGLEGDTRTVLAALAAGLSFHWHSQRKKGIREG